MSDSINLPVMEEPTSDDRLLAVLAYLLTPLAPIIILLSTDKRTRPFIKAHNYQALVLGIILVVFFTVMSFFPVVNCVAAIISLGIVIYCAIKANRGELIRIPIITKLVISQGWSESNP